MSEEGIFARIPLDELTIYEACAQVTDDSFFRRTRMPILFHFDVTVDNYWSLTVGDHREMVAYLVGLRLYADD